MWVKICGVRTLEAALIAEEAGANAIGIGIIPMPPSPTNSESVVVAGPNIECTGVVRGGPTVIGMLPANTGTPTVT